MKKSAITYTSFIAALFIICCVLVSGCARKSVNNAILPETVSFTKDEITVFKGENAALELSFSTLQPVTSPASYSYDDSIFKVNGEGTVTGVSEGSSVLTVTTEEGSFARCVVKVVSRATAIYLDSVTCGMYTGETLELKCTATPVTAVYTLEWTSSDMNVATVSNGNVTAINPGTTLIRAETENGVYSECEVTVYSVPYVTLETGTVTLYSPLSDVVDVFGSAAYTVALPLSCKAYVFNKFGTFSQYLVVFSDGENVLGFYTDTPGFDMGDIKSGMTAEELNKTFGIENEPASDILYIVNDDAFDVFFDNLGDGKAYGVMVLGKGCDVLASAPSTEMIEGYNLIMADLTNSVRVKHGLGILLYNDKLAECAEKHSLDMVVHNFASHDSSDGRKLADRITETGLKWHYCGENIAAGYRLPFLTSAGLLNSSGHRTNILNENFKYIGVGTVYGKDTEYLFYSTQNYCSLFD